jgi:general secretion pathway protein N
VSLRRPRPVSASARREADRETQRWQRAQRAGRRWGAWGLVLGLGLGAVMNAPAQWLAQALASATGDHLLLAETQGSLWEGSAVLVLTGGQGSQDASALPGRLHWTLRPHGMALRLAARQDCCLDGALLLTLQPRWGGYTLSLATAELATPAIPNTLNDGQPVGHWPAAWLAGLGTPWNTLQLGGQVLVRSPGFTLESTQGRVQTGGQLILQLKDASSRLSPMPSLGSYQFTLQGQGPAGNAATPTTGAPTATMLRLDSQEGPLRLNGTGQWTATGLRFRGEAQADPGHEAGLANLLNIIGRRQGALSVISIG